MLTYDEWIASLQKHFENNGYNDYLVDGQDWKDAYDAGISPEEAYENYMLGETLNNLLSPEGDATDENCDECDGCGC